MDSFDDRCQELQDELNQIVAELAALKKTVETVGSAARREG